MFDQAEMDQVESMINRAQFWKDEADASDGMHILDHPPGSWVMTGVALAAGMMTRELLMAAWKKSTGETPPENPAAMEVSWTDAIIWAATVGATVGVARVIARRGTTSAVRTYYNNN